MNASSNHINKEPSLRKHFEIDRLKETIRPVIAENFVLEDQKIDTLTTFEIVHQEISLIRTPLAFLREYNMAGIEKKTTTLQLQLGLSWNGYQDAIELLFAISESFQRPIPIEKTINITKEYDIGDVGFAWSWSVQKDPDYLAFVRNNILVNLQGNNVQSLLITIAKDIDNTLTRLKTTDHYQEDPKGIFLKLKEKIGDHPNVPAGGTLTIGPIPCEKVGNRHFLFFFTPSGSINRDRTQPEIWYYRAGMEEKEQEIILFRGMSGILPLKDRLIISVHK